MLIWLVIGALAAILGPPAWLLWWAVAAVVPVPTAHPARYPAR